VPYAKWRRHTIAAPRRVVELCDSLYAEEFGFGLTQVTIYDETPTDQTEVHPSKSEDGASNYVTSFPINLTLDAL
jgi:hypothetical protein